MNIRTLIQHTIQNSELKVNVVSMNPVDYQREFSKEERQCFGGIRILGCDVVEEVHVNEGEFMLGYDPRLDYLKN